MLCTQYKIPVRATTLNQSLHNCVLHCYEIEQVEKWKHACIVSRFSPKRYRAYGTNLFELPFIHVMHIKRNLRESNEKLTKLDCVSTSILNFLHLSRADLFHWVAVMYDEFVWQIRFLSFWILLPWNLSKMLLITQM